MCTNTDGSFKCDCQSGFEGDGETCIGVYVVLIILRYVIVVLLLQILMNVIWILTTVMSMLSVQILMVALHVIVCLVSRETERLVQVFMWLFLSHTITCDIMNLFCFVLLKTLMNVVWILTTVMPMLSVQILMVALHVIVCLVLREMERLVQVFMC